MLDFVLLRLDLQGVSSLSRWEYACHRTYARIQDQHCHIWLHRLANLYHLLEQLALLLMSATRIHNDHFESLLLEFCNTLRCDGDGVRLRIGTKVRYLGFRSRLAGLIECTSTERISADDT